MFNRHRTALKFIGTVLLWIVMTMTMSSCKSAKGLHSSSPGDPHSDEIHIVKPDRAHYAVLDEAMTWLGTPYRYAGVDKGEGCDCSGLVMCVFEKATGLKIPRNSARQAEFCIPINASEVNAGDLVFFATGHDPERVSHVGIVIDNRQFIHASSSKGVVISEFTTPYWTGHFRMFGRVPFDQAFVSDR